jgi:hypothetical protein
MAKRQDLRQDENGDIYINTSTGDFSIVESDNQHVSDILQAVSGDYKEFPLIGVNFFRFQNSTGQQQVLEGIIRTQLRADGYSVKKVEIPESVTSLEDIVIYADGPDL